MAVSRVRQHEIPKDAVILSKTQVLNYHQKIITNWHTPNDVWILNYGSGILGVLAGVTGVYVNNHYRLRMRLGSFGYASSYLPIIFLPAIMSALFHKAFIQPEILLQRHQCIVCLQTKAMALQSFFGGVYPMLLAPIASYNFALRHFTYRVPSFTKDPKLFLKMHKKMTAPITLGMSIALAIQLIATSWLTYKEMEEFLTIERELQQVEIDVENRKQNKMIDSSS